MQRSVSSCAGGLYGYSTCLVITKCLGQLSHVAAFLLRKILFYALAIFGSGFCKAEVLEADFYAISPSQQTHYATAKTLARGLTPSSTSPTQAWQTIHEILDKHWQPAAADPKNSAMLLEQMAKYYSQFEQVKTLIEQLSGKAWSLHYAKNEFVTRASGSSLTIKSVKIFFDPLSAGQFRFHNACKHKLAYCVAAPADVLLHELLHARAILNETSSFLSGGGMNTVMYPYQHEYTTIRLEQQLYRSMTSIDNRPRPIRSDHVGHHLTVACATCLE